jgi:hypothetical protein
MMIIRTGLDVLNSDVLSRTGFWLNVNHRSESRLFFASKIESLDLSVGSILSALVSMILLGG